MEKMQPITLHTTPVSQRPFRGIGVQTDARRVSPGVLPPDADLPVAREETLTPITGRLACTLAPAELLLLRN